MDEQSKVEWGSMGPLVILLCLALAAGIVKFQTPLNVKLKEIKPQFEKTQADLGAEFKDFFKSKGIFKAQCTYSPNTIYLKRNLKETNFIIANGRTLAAVNCFKYLGVSIPLGPQDYVLLSLELTENGNGVSLVSNQPIEVNDTLKKGLFTWLTTETNITSAETAAVETDLATSSPRLRVGEQLLSQSNDAIVTYRRSSP